MARTVDRQQHARRRAEILDAARYLVQTRGYDRMTIQELRRLVGMSNGTFFHYFTSKTEVLQAFVDRIRVETETPLLPVVDDPQLPALAKLQRFFDTFDQLHEAAIDAVVPLLRVWYTDGNAVVRQRVDDATREQRAPLLARVVRQGVDERVFDTAHPDEAADAVLALGQRMGAAHAALLLDADERTAPARAERVVAVHAAFCDAVERVLGGPAGCLRRTDTATALHWIGAVHTTQDSTPEDSE